MKRIAATLGVVFLTVLAVRSQEVIVTGADPNPPLVYATPVVYQAPVVYQGPVVYQAPVFYGSGGVIVAGGTCASETSPVSNVERYGSYTVYSTPACAPSVIYFGRGQAYQQGYRFSR